MACDACDHVGEPGLRLDAVETRRAQERVEPGSALPARIRTAEQPILSAEGCRPDLVLGGIVADFEPAVIEVAGERSPPRAGVAYGAGKIALAGDFPELLVKPDRQLVYPGP